MLGLTVEYKQITAVGANQGGDLVQHFFPYIVIGDRLINVRDDVENCVVVIHAGTLFCCEGVTGISVPV